MQGLRSTSAQKRAEVLRNPYIFEGPQTKGDKIRIHCLTPAFSGAEKRGRKCFATHAFLGVPKQRGMKSEVAASPLPSRGGPQEGEGRGEAATSDFIPLCLGTPENAWVTKHLRPLLGPREGKGEVATSDFIPLCFGTPENVGVT